MHVGRVEVPVASHQGKLASKLCRRSRAILARGPAGALLTWLRAGSADGRNVPRPQLHMRRDVNACGIGEQGRAQEVWVWREGCTASLKTGQGAGDSWQVSGGQHTRPPQRCQRAIRPDPCLLKLPSRHTAASSSAPPAQQRQPPGAAAATAAANCCPCHICAASAAALSSAAVSPMRAASWRGVCPAWLAASGSAPYCSSSSNA